MQTTHEPRQSTFGRLIELSDAEYQSFQEIIYRESRINLGPNKKGLVNSRLSKRLRLLGLESFTAYLDLLKSPKGGNEMTHFIDALSTNHTFFFREMGHYRFLNEVVLPRFLSASGGNCWAERTFKVWSAACSSGEEPYSIAMSLHGPLLGAGRDWSVHATDISTSVLGKASKGIYPYDKAQTIDERFLKTCFQRGSGRNEGMIRAKDEIRRRINFHQLNLLDASYPFSERFHVVFNRNVMIYFDPKTQQELLDKMVPQIAPGGYLFIGHSESLTGINHPLKQVQPSIFQKP